MKVYCMIQGSGLKKRYRGVKAVYTMGGFVCMRFKKHGKAPKRLRGKILKFCPGVVQYLTQPHKRHTAST